MDRFPLEGVLLIVLFVVLCVLARSFRLEKFNGRSGMKAEAVAKPKQESSRSRLNLLIIVLVAAGLILVLSLLSNQRAQKLNHLHINSPQDVTYNAKPVVAKVMTIKLMALVSEALPAQKLILLIAGALSRKAAVVNSQGREPLESMPFSMTKPQRGDRNGQAHCRPVGA